MTKERIYNCGKQLNLLVVIESSSIDLIEFNFYVLLLIVFRLVIFSLCDDQAGLSLSYLLGCAFHLVVRCSLSSIYFAKLSHYIPSFIVFWWSAVVCKAILKPSGRKTTTILLVLMVPRDWDHLGFHTPDLCVAALEFWLQLR